MPETRTQFGREAKLELEPGPLEADVHRRAYFLPFILILRPLQAQRMVSGFPLGLT